MAKRKVCAIVGCGKKASSRGWCEAHYERWRRYGDLRSDVPLLNSLVSWLKARRRYKGQECLIWPTKNKKPMLWLHGRHMSAARVMCYLAHGAPPFKGAMATHLCGRGHSCVNPRHLRWATAKQNQIDRLRDGTDNRGERHANSKLTRAQVIKIRKLVAEGRMNQKTIGRMFGTSSQYVGELVRKRTWAWLK